MSRIPLLVLIGLTAVAAFLPSAARASGADSPVLPELAGLHQKIQDQRDAVRADAKALRDGQYDRALPPALARMLSGLPALIDRYQVLQTQASPGSTDLFAQAKDAVAAAEDAQAPYWAEHADRGRSAGVPSERATSDLPDRLERVDRLLSALITLAKTRVPALGRFAAPRAAVRGPDGTSGSGYRGAGGILNCANAFDGAACSGSVSADGGSRAEGTPRGSVKTASVVGAGSGATANGSAPVKNGAAVAMSGANPRLDSATIPGPNADSAKASPAPAPSANCTHAVNGFDAEHPQHAAIASLCGKAPAGLMWAPPMLAGMVDSIKEQFGTVQGILMQIGFFVLGLMAAVATGALGVILKLIALIGAGWAIGKLLWGLQKAVRAALAAPEGSVERYQALRSLGASLTSLVVLVVMVLAGVKYGKSAAMKGMESGVAKAMSGLGLKTAGPAAAAGAGAASSASTGASGGLKQLASEVLGGENPADASPAPTPNPKAVEPPETTSMNPETPPPPATPKSMEWLERAAEMDAGMQERAAVNPNIGKAFIEGSLKNLSSDGLGARGFKARSSAALEASQRAISNQLRGAALEVARSKGIKPDALISHGTSLQGLLGMIMKGEISSTLRQTGISGESANIWGAHGVDVGASYGMTKGMALGQPSVEILIRPSADLKVQAGATLSRAPTVAKDFLAAIITDGKKTIVLNEATLRALAASAQKWAAEAKAAAYAGRMSEFDKWERVDERLSPK